MAKKQVDENGMVVKKPFGTDTFLCIGIVGIVIAYCGSVMGLGNFINSLMNSGMWLVINLCLYLCGLGGIMGAFVAVLSEFGFIALLNKIIAPLMRPIYGLPGAASLGAVSTFFGDSPAIVACAKDEKFIKYFKPYQRPLLCNLGMAYGMGMIVVTFFISFNIDGGLTGAFVGLFGAVVGSIISVRLMARSTKKYYHISREESKADHALTDDYVEEDRRVSASLFDRVLITTLNGAKKGMTLGFDIMPAALTIALIMLTLTWGPGEGGVYDGSACQGIALIPKLGEIFLPVTRLLFGFEHGSDVAFPLTSIASVGSAMGIVPAMVAEGTISANDVAVFTAMGMCWSGYMSNCVGMMEALNEKQFIKPVIVSHTIGGLVAGIFAHIVMVVL